MSAGEADAAALATALREDYLTAVLPSSLTRMTLPKKVTTVVSTKGQVILPKAIRDEKHWMPGDKLVVESTPEGVLLRSERVFPATKFDDVRGCLAHNGKKALSLDEIDGALRTAAKRRYARG